MTQPAGLPGVEPRARPIVWPGLTIAALVLCVYGGLALTVDFPRASQGIQSDEATYYMMGYSLALDHDLAYRREDLMRVWREFPGGPAGVFLKKGRDLTGLGVSAHPPFLAWHSRPDPDTARLFYGKAFIYPLCAAPFVRAFGTNGFLVLHALLLALALFCAYLFLHARAPAAPSAVIAGAFVFASVVPVYFVWIMPELFNFSLALLAYFCWLYKEVASRDRSPRGTGWLFGGASDIVAGVLLGVVTFSKPSNALLVVPIVAWQLWRKRWAPAIATSVVFFAVAGGLFGANLGISGDWNYQGGERSTFYAQFPFQTPAAGFDVGLRKARDEALTNIIFDRSVFWTNLFHNLEYFFVGRYAGLVGYFFPAVFALVAFFWRPRRRPVWQYLVLASGFAQILLFIVSLPYTWLGGGGSVGNRYFMGVYGIFLFLLPPISRVWVAVVPWAVGGLFAAQLVLTPFATSAHPGNYANDGPLRWFPPELTLVNDWPINTDPTRVRQWFGDNPGTGDPGFQIYFFDDHAYAREADRSFWVKGQARAEFLIKSDQPVRRAVFSLSAGPRATGVTVTVAGRTQRFQLPPDGTQQVSFALPPGFPYQGRSVWVASISSSTGFTPLFYGSGDARYLGVRVKPMLIR
ncbi:MAG TPA: hypothetical protein VFX12_12995 [Vicinamibacterales bacterium]|nr:hypothetical protein [Vicinamibacterales bacterium]